MQITNCTSTLKPAHLWLNSRSVGVGAAVSGWGSSRGSTTTHTWADRRHRSWARRWCCRLAHSSTCLSARPLSTPAVAGRAYLRRPTPELYVAGVLWLARAWQLTRRNTQIQRPPWSSLQSTSLQWIAVWISVFVNAEILGKSPQKLFMFITRKQVC